MKRPYVAQNQSHTRLADLLYRSDVKNKPISPSKQTRPSPPNPPRPTVHPTQDPQPQNLQLATTPPIISPRSPPPARAPARAPATPPSQTAAKSPPRWRTSRTSHRQRPPSPTPPSSGPCATAATARPRPRSCCRTVRSGRRARRR